MSTGDRQLANAKLTITLRIVGRRRDGYHELSSEMVTLDLCDELEIVEGDGLEIDDRIDWCGSAAPRSAEIPSGDDNLVARALAMVGRRAFVRLIKRIPAGAGLGGGSADAAAILRWAGLQDLSLAASLGADVPFCVRGGRAQVSGIGEVLEDLPVVPRAFVLLSPDLPVSTAAVYQAFDALASRGVGPGARNDLELAALAVEPRLSWWRELLGELSGREPCLAGSGSTWFVEADASRDEQLVERLQEAVAAANRRACVSLCRTTDAVPLALG